MPYSVGQRDRQWCVLGPDDDPVPGGCHETREDALAHQRALTVNVPDARMAAISDAFPLFPPAEWFDPPADIQPGQRASVTTEGPEAGRYVAIVAPFSQCILNGREQQECWTAPPSPTGYAAAHQGATRTASGTIIDTANIGGGTNHAPPSYGLRQAVDHYANTASQTIRVRYHDVPGVGVVACGALWPGLSDRDVERVRASALSGDWRWRRELGLYDMSGSQLVSTPGFPRMPKVAAYAASLTDEHPAIIGGWGGPPSEEPMPNQEPVLTLTLSATETARLHALLTGPTQTAEPAAPCACQSHTAAAGDPALAEAVAPEMGAPTREEFDALARQVEELQGQIMSDALADVDGMVAALPLPPDLEDEHRWAMPAAAFDESKHPRKPRGMAGGGRFAELIRELAAEPGKVDPADPRLDEAAEAGGTSKGVAAQQVNVVKRRIENGTEEAFQKQLADSESLLEDEDILDAMGGGKAMPPDVRDRLAQAVDAIDETPGLVDSSPELADFVERATLLLQRSETGSLVNA